MHNADHTHVPDAHVMLVVESRRRYAANDQATASARIAAARTAHRNAKTGA